MARKVWVFLAAGLLGLAVALGCGIAQLMGVGTGVAGYAAAVMGVIAALQLGFGAVARFRSSRWVRFVLHRGRVSWIGAGVPVGLVCLGNLIRHQWVLALGMFWLLAMTVVLAVVSEPEDEWRQPGGPAGPVSGCR